MTLLGCDVSVEYTPTFSVEAAYAAGLRFLGTKLSDGVKGTEIYEHGIDLLLAARVRRMAAIGYHFVRPDIDASVQADMFARQLDRAGVAGVLDVESGTAATVDLAREIHLRVVTLGHRVAFTYLPKWWHATSGSPSLAGLPPLWGSRYVTSAPGVEAVGTPQQIAAGINPSWWDPYGGKQVVILQYTQKATVGGLTVTADAYPGSLADLELLT